MSNLLNYIGKKLRLDIYYFISGGFFGLIQQIIGLASGAVVIYLLGHFVSQTVFGKYNLLLSTISLITFFSLPGIDKALTQSVGKGYDNSLDFSLKAKIKFSLLGSLSLLGFAGYYFLQQKATIATGLVISALAYPFLYSFTIYISFLTVKQRFDTLAFFASLSSVFFLITMTISILVFHAALAIIIGYLIGLILPALFGFVYSHRYISNKKSDHGLFSYGKFLTFLTVLPWISGNLGKVVLGNLLGVEQLAIYSVAIGFIVIIQKQLIVFYKPVTAKLATQSKKQHWQTLRVHAFKLVSLGLGLFTILWFAIPILVSFFYQPAYEAAIGYGRLLSFSVIPLPITWVLSNMMLYQKKKQVQIIMSSFPHLAMISLYLILIPKLGINGLIISFLFERYTTPFIPLLSLLRDNLLIKK